MTTSEEPSIGRTGSRGFAAVVIGALLLVSCGDDDSTSSTDDGTTTSTTAETPPDDSNSNNDSSLGRIVEPRSGMDDLVEVAIIEATTSDSGLTIWFESNGVEPCWVVDSIEVDDSGDNEVTVTVRGGSDPAEPDAICIEITEFLGVEIGVALDGRDVVDGSNGASVPVRS